ncbi:IclR family transcriptional regulator [Desulfoferula mesophila]|uniref:IclR family transcriptional regulator n=1 Tax=Desulfoferula mesophila TaxID=3058419 RepID=A0AAU9EHR1_9BACT|nr:IclR family transcriptional regulator [Desulfoferula mesophilus]
MRDRMFVKSVGKGIAILELLGSSTEPLSLTQMAERLETNKTTVQRFLYTLMELGYVRILAGKRYMLGNKVLSLAFQFLNSEGVFSIARPYLEDLSSNLERSVSMGVLDGDEVLVIFRKERTRFYPFAVYVGSRVPAHCTTMGKVLLAALPIEKAKELLHKMNLFKVTPNTVINKNGILKDLKVTRERGYAISDGEFSLDLYSIGVPLLNHEGQVVASVALSLNISDKGLQKTVDNALDKLLKTGKIISQGLGYEGSYPVIPA